MQTILYDRADPISLRRTRLVRDDLTGLPLIISEQNTRPVVEAAKRAASNFDPAQKRRGFYRCATIPKNIWRQLVRTGVAGDPKAFTAWLNHPDQRVFRTDDGRKL